MSVCCGDVNRKSGCLSLPRSCLVSHALEGRVSLSMTSVRKYEFQTQTSAHQSRHINNAERIIPAASSAHDATCSSCWQWEKGARCKRAKHFWPAVLRNELRYPDRLSFWTPGVVAAVVLRRADCCSRRSAVYAGTLSTASVDGFPRAWRNVVATARTSSGRDLFLLRRWLTQPMAELTYHSRPDSSYNGTEEKAFQTEHEETLPYLRCGADNKPLINSGQHEEWTSEYSTS